MISRLIGLSSAAALVGCYSVWSFHRMAANSDESDGAFPKPLFENGRYEIPWPVAVGRPSVLGFLWEYRKYKENGGVPSEKELNNIEEMKILSLNDRIIKNPSANQIQATWLGHASFLIQLDHINILFDPVFSSNIGPLQFLSLGQKRFRECPCTVDELPQNIHLVLISHDHYDHLDLRTVKDLDTRYGSSIQWMVPLGMFDWFRKTLKSSDNVKELNWWDELELELEKTKVKIACVPAQHWCKRGYDDDNKRLWAGWIVKGEKHSVYHAGDTGYCDIFKSIGKRYGPIDLSLIPIGAYFPRPILSFQHVDPQEAVQIHQDVRAVRSIGMHWGTFESTKEPFLEPPLKIKQALEERGLKSDEFITVKHGETVSFD